MSISSARGVDVGVGSLESDIVVSAGVVSLESDIVVSVWVDPAQRCASFEAEAVAVLVPSRHTSRPPAKSMLKTSICRPGLNLVGCSRSSGSGENRLLSPIGMVIVDENVFV